MTMIMNTSDLIGSICVLMLLLAFYYVTYKAGYNRGSKDLSNHLSRRELIRWDEGYKAGLELGEKRGYTKGRAEGYEDGRRYEAVTHHNQTELEKLLEKETAKAAKG